MGEIGFSRDKFLYALKWWEIKAIIDGYRKRERTFCMMMRWSTFMVMSTGMADLGKAGIHQADDLLRFPWEHDYSDDNMPSMEVVEEMRRQLQEENARIKNSTEA